MDFTELKAKMDQAHYIYDDTLATTVYVALALGRPVKTIHTQLSRGKRLLREQLERRNPHGAV